MQNLNIKKAVLWGLLFISSQAWADIQASFKREQLFEKMFFSHYQAGQCGDNIKRYVQALAQSGRDIRGLRIVFMENNGLSSFGMVNAERARGIMRGQPANEERNWYHHVFAVDRDGYVYDFDFTTAPRIVPFNRYVYYMYLDEPECQKPPLKRGFCGGVQTKMRDYELKWYRASDVVELAHPQPYYKSSLLQGMSYAVRYRSRS